MAVKRLLDFGLTLPNEVSQEEAKAYSLLFLKLSQSVLTCTGGESFRAEAVAQDGYEWDIWKRKRTAWEPSA